MLHEPLRHSVALSTDAKGSLHCISTELYFLLVPTHGKDSIILPYVMVPSTPNRLEIPRRQTLMYQTRTDVTVLGFVKMAQAETEQ